MSCMYFQVINGTGRAQSVCTKNLEVVVIVTGSGGDFDSKDCPGIILEERMAVARHGSPASGNFDVL